MIQDIFPHRLRNEFIPHKAVESEGWLFAFDEGEIHCRLSQDAVQLPKVADDAEPAACRYLFSLDGVPCYLSQSGRLRPGTDFERAPVRTLRRQVSGPREVIFAAWTAFQLYNWYRDNRYCGRCGGVTEPAEDERAMVCPACRRRIYPRIIPAVIVGVIHGDDILLTKYSGRDIPYYALIAGFTEIGETLEETVAREVMEEAGLRVKNIRYYKSQPWAIVDDLLAGFYCDVDGDATIHMDRRELKEALWVPRREVIGQPNDFSLTHEMMMTFKAGREPR